MDAAVESFIRERVPGIADKVLAQVRPYISAESGNAADADIPLGRSKLGGRPDVPSDFQWPTTDAPCWFVAQINLAEMRSSESGFPLPGTGLLSFFYHDDRGPPGKGSRVYFFPPKGLRRADVVVDQRYGVDFHNRHLYSRLLTLSQGYRAPDRIQRYALTPRERAAWEDPDDTRGPDVIGQERGAFDHFDYFHEMFHNRFSPATHRLFGLPSYEAKYPVPRGYQLLASFGEMADRINFYVPKDSIEELDFGKVKVAYECT